MMVANLYVESFVMKKLSVRGSNMTNNRGILQGDVIEKLKELESESVNCVVTSPPYWGLRDYGTGTWEGGDPDCDHKGKPIPTRKSIHDRTQPQCNNKPDENVFEIYKDVCPKCGAKRIDRQIGLEPTPEEYVKKLVDVFREVKRVLRKDGTVWLNLGDSYAMSSIRGGNKEFSGNVGAHKGYDSGSVKMGKRNVPQGLKPKDLVGIPWRVAFALQADGWYLRSDIIWAKPNPMPESVRDRPTKAHEYIFLLTKSPKYYYDVDAIRELSTGQVGTAADFKRNTKEALVPGQSRTSHREDRKPTADNGTRNKRSVWTIATQPYPEAHFAVYPEKLIEPCIKAGCPKDGIVLDPFFGSGTTGLVARKLLRNWIGIELNPEYVKIAEKRLKKIPKRLDDYDK